MLVDHDAHLPSFLDGIECLFSGHLADAGAEAVVAPVILVLVEQTVLLEDHLPHLPELHGQALAVLTEALLGAVEQVSPLGLLVVGAPLTAREDLGGGDAVADDVRLVRGMVQHLELYAHHVGAEAGGVGLPVEGLDLGVHEAATTPGHHELLVMGFAVDGRLVDTVALPCDEGFALAVPQTVDPRVSLPPRSVVVERAGAVHQEDLVDGPSRLGESVSAQPVGQPPLAI